jgi:hypothetical protein
VLCYCATYNHSIYGAIVGLEATIRMLRSCPKFKARTDNFMPARLIESGAAGYISERAGHKS